MKIQQLQVQRFMQEIGQFCPIHPCIPEKSVCDLRTELIDEELSELNEALTDGDIIATADAIGDLLVVVLGTAVACGIDIEPIFNEIHRSNMSKVIDGYTRPDGKWMKGKSYTPPRLSPILDLQ